MKKHLINFVLLVLAFSNLQMANGQTDRRPTGLVFDDVAYNEVRHLPRYEGSKYHNVPLVHSLRQYCPYPGDQGNVGSCVGWASAYGGYTISKAIKHGITDRAAITTEAQSASYIYNQIQIPSSLPCWGGSKITDAILVMSEGGSASVNTFANSSNDCTEMPNDLSRSEAEYFKLKDFAAIFHMFDESEVKIDKTIKSIAADNPVVIGLQVSTSFWDIKEGDKFWRPKSTDQDLGGHALVVVGYDYAMKAFEIMNSYGPNWGDEGFFWVSFDDYGKYCKYGFQLIPEDDVPFKYERPIADNTDIIDDNDNEDVVEEEIEGSDETEVETPEEEVIVEIPTVEMSGEFMFNSLVGYTKNDEGAQVFDFKGTATAFNEEKGIYELIDGSRKVGDVFQMVAANIPKGSNLYVLSMDADAKVELHFPVPEINPQTGAECIDAMGNVKLSSALIPSEKVEVVMPGKDEGMRLDVAGEDNLCVLYSNERIEDIESVIEQMKGMDGNINERLQATLGDQLIASENINYAADNMSFTSSSKEGEGTIVPLVLSVTAN